MIPVSFVYLTSTSVYLLSFGEGASDMFLNMGNLKHSQSRDNHVMNSHIFITYPQGLASWTVF